MTKKFVRWAFYLTWVVLLVVQAKFSHLIADEAYYWKWSQHLSWGYYDHPPVVAFIIAIGYSLFKNELGVRIVGIIVSVLTIYLVEKMVRPEKPWLLYIIISSVALMHFVGCLALPDNPVLFCSALFLFFLQRFLDNDSKFNAIMLGCAAGAMLLSKYTGVLVVFFSIAPHYSLLKKKSFWLAVLAGVAVLIPHGIWQLENGFPSIMFNLVERNSTVYYFRYTYEYLFSAPFLFGPFIGIAMLYSAWKFKAVSRFHRSCKWLVMGTYVFFLVMTFKNEIEGNWVLIALVPSFIICYEYCLKNIAWRKFVVRTFPVAIILILIVRSSMVADFLPKDARFKGLNDKFDFNIETWAQETRKITGERPVIFDSYQNAALYEFYTRIPTAAYPDVRSKYINNNEIRSFQNRDVAIITGNKTSDWSIKITHAYPYDPNWCFFVNNFATFLDYKLVVSKQIVCVADAKKLTIQLQPVKLAVARNESKECFGYLCYRIINAKRDTVSDIRTALKLDSSMMNSGKPFELTIACPLEKGKYEIRFFIEYYPGLTREIASGYYPVTVE